MILDSILVGLAILGAVAILVRQYMPKPARKGACAPACGACAAKPR